MIDKINAGFKAGEITVVYANSSGKSQLAKGVAMSHCQFVNAQEMHRAHPDTFWAPSADDLSQIKVGDIVKVCANQCERFWTIVTGIDGDMITAIVNNDLIYTNKHGLRCDDKIQFHRDCVYQVFDKG